VVLPDPVIHLYWAYAMARAEEMFKVTRFPPGFCGAQAERQFVIPIVFAIGGDPVDLPGLRSPARFKNFWKN
jgi:hypothetical protein